MLMVTLWVPAQSQSFRRLVREADTLFARHDFFQAIELYRQAIEKRSRDNEVLGKLGNSYRITNQMEEASAAYARAIDTRRPDPEHLLQYGHVLKSLGQYEEARRQFLAYAETNPTVGNHFAESCNFALYQRGADNGVVVTNLAINTASDEYGPTFHQQGLVFSSSRFNPGRPSPLGTEVDSFAQPNELFLAIRGEDGALRNPQPLLRNAGWEGANIGPVAFSSDGNQVAYTRNNFKEGVRFIPESGMKLDLFLGVITPDGNWAGEQSFPFNGPNHSNGFPSFSPEGDALFFASNLGSGYGGYDIFVSYRQGNSWSPPQNLGPTVNTPGNEISPFFDGVQLFFASDWHPGLGGYDLFRAEQQGERWSQVFHLGAPVNSPRDDFGGIYHAFSNTGFLSSNRRDSRGGLDIYQLARPAETVVIRVERASDGSPIQGAVIDFSNCGEGLRQTNRAGVFQFPAADEINCQVVVRKDDYVDQVIALQSDGQPGSQQLLVSMNRRDEEYVGRISDYESGLPIPTATVTAVNQSNGHITRVNTDPNGNYRLGLAPNAVYLVSYSAPGYREAMRSIPVHPGDDPGLLGSISLLSQSSPLPAGVSSASQIIEQELSGTGTSATRSVLPSGFAVQVAALSRPTLDRFDNLKSFGEVYSVPEGGRHKIRVGVFPDRSQAQQALASVKGAGYPTAFIVSEKGGTIPEAQAGTLPSASQFASKGVSAPSGTAGNYRIQVGAFRHAYNFKDWQMADIGSIVDQKRGNLTIKYLAGYNTLAEAQTALAKVHAAGYPGAFIVENRGGTWHRLR